MEGPRAIMRHVIQAKRGKKGLTSTENLFRKNLQVKGVY